MRTLCRFHEFGCSTVGSGWLTQKPIVVSWIGFQDAARHGHPEWRKWIVFNKDGVVYCADTRGKSAVPPREGRWDLADWAAEHNLGVPGKHPPPNGKLRIRRPEGAVSEGIPEVVEVPEEALALLVSMGFPQAKCEAALRAADLDVERATEWLLANIDDDA